LTEDRRILVYVQAVPSSVPPSLKQFSDLETCDFNMSHSSRVALSFASTLGFSDIVAAGFSPIMKEALARGASSCYSMPLCDDPFDQISFFPTDDFSNIVVGENPDWVFSGASLCGAIIGAKGFDLAPISKELPPNSIMLVPDSGEETSGVDIRRISFSSSSMITASFNAALRGMEVPRQVKDLGRKDAMKDLASSKNPERVFGSSIFAKSETKRSEQVSGSPKEIVSTLTRRIRRLVIFEL